MFSPLTENSLQLVSQAHKYLPTYGGSLSNHLPMVLMAMEKIGANRQQLETEYRAHEQHLELFSESRLINNLQPERGNPDTLLALIDFYHADIVANGIREAVGKAINELLPGLSAASFHGIIRLSYAVESDSPHEVSHALGLFAANYVSPGPLIRDPMLTLEQHLGNATTRFSDQKYPEGLISDDIQFLSQQPRYQEVAAVPEVIDRAKIVRIVTTQFIASNDFTLLHGVTGLQALLSLEPFIDDIDKALGYFWQAYVAAVCTSTYRHAFVPLATTSDNQKEWNSWFTKALASKNDHTIKLVHSCAWLYQSIALPELLMAIQAVLGEQS